MMKTQNLKIKYLLVSLAFCFTFIFSILLNSSVSADANAANANNSASAAGSADDPLVTLSYINKVLMPKIDSMISAKLSANPAASATSAASTASPASTASIDSLATVPAEATETSVSPPPPPSPATTTAAAVPAATDLSQQNDASSVMQAAALQLVQLTKGQKITAKSGVLEMILRPGGTAAVVSSYQTQGIADLTAGNEILNNRDVPVNHSLIIPRADGRGIIITSVIAYILVRGDYEIS